MPPGKSGYKSHTMSSFIGNCEIKEVKSWIPPFFVICMRQNTLKAMSTLYFNKEQALRLRKLLLRVEELIADPRAYSLNLYLARAGLCDLISGLSPMSSTRGLVLRIIGALPDLKTAREKQTEILSILSELRKLYPE